MDQAWTASILVNMTKYEKSRLDRQQLSASPSPATNSTPLRISKVTLVGVQNGTRISFALLR